LRPIDFLVYYISTLYFKRIKGNLYFDSFVERTVYIVGLLLGLWFSAIIEIITALFFHTDLSDNSPFFVIGMFITVMLVITVLKYIYIRKKRYEFIASSKYRAFSLNENIGLTISLTLLLMSIIAAVLSAVLVHWLIV